MLTIIILLNFIYLVNCKYEAVDYLDLNKYIGTWYEVYGDNFDKTFQGNGRCIEAYYKFNDYNVSVLNTQINKDDTRDSISGYAYYKDNDTGGYLTVQLDDLPEAPYWVIELGPIIDEFYDYSIVSDNQKLSLFVLARNVSRFYEKYNDIVLESLENFGFTRFINSPYKIDQNC